MKIEQIELNGNAPQGLEDFIKYANLNPESAASIQHNDLNGFKQRAALFQRKAEGGTDNGEKIL